MLMVSMTWVISKWAEGREAPERHPGLRCIAVRMQSKDVTTHPVARCYNVT